MIIEGEDGGNAMKCERCLSTAGEYAEFRVRTDIIDLKICRHCALEARALGLVIEPLIRSDELRAASLKKLMNNQLLSETEQQ